MLVVVLLSSALLSQQQQMTSGLLLLLPNVIYLTPFIPFQPNNLGRWWRARAPPAVLLLQLC
jgi:hypothetical protein